jgi:chromosomal replication initiator protein
MPDPAFDSSAPPNTIWVPVLNDLERQLESDQFRVLFGNTELLQFDGTAARIAVRDQVQADMLLRAMGETVRAAFARVTGCTPELDVVVREAAGGTPAPVLNELYTFENFVVGSSNRLAHAAAVAVAESPGLAYNPLFLHGPVGLGKTHLLQAICHALLRKPLKRSVLYLTCEAFTNDFVGALERGALDRFRHRYRHVDVLVIDDIQFLAKTEKTQEEFFHTFNTLYNAKKQLILSSDAPPKEIPSLEERLVSRFKWGLVTTIEPPSLEMRVAIVRNKARLRSQDFPADVVQFVAEHLTSNIRELEGAVVKLIAYSHLMDKPIDLPLAKEVFRDTVHAPAHRVTIDSIVERVTQTFKVKLSDLQSKRRTKSISLPRQVCMSLARRFTDHSLEEIGGYFGGRDHTTVIAAIERVQTLRERDPQLNALVERLARELTTP